MYKSFVKQLLIKRLLTLFVVVALAGCIATQPSSRYQQRHDSAPTYGRDLAKIPDAVPIVEARSKQGNKSPYKVLGKTYRLLPDSKGYQTIGTASWYGSKFHGHLTSNGETYNMFAMSAAHKSLPIPTYLQVTNLANGRKVVVRVNDRGPFHGNRVIDLSYAAAVKLGFDKLGTAQVKLEAIDPKQWQLARLGPSVTDDIYLQVGAFSSFQSAHKLKQRLVALTGQRVNIQLDTARTPNLHKVRVGPIKDLVLAQQIRQRINSEGLGLPLIVSLPQG